MATTVDFGSLERQINALISAIDRLDRQTENLSSTFKAAGTSANQIKRIAESVKSVDPKAGEKLKDIGKGISGIAAATKKFGEAGSGSSIERMVVSIGELSKLAKQYAGLDMRPYLANAGQSFGKFAQELAIAGPIAENSIRALGAASRFMVASLKVSQTAIENFGSGNLGEKLLELKERLTEFYAALNQSATQKEINPISIRAINALSSISRVFIKLSSDNVDVGKAKTTLKQITNAITVSVNDINAMPVLDKLKIRTVNAISSVITSFIRLSNNTTQTLNKKSTAAFEGIFLTVGRVIASIAAVKISPAKITAISAAIGTIGRFAIKVAPAVGAADFTGFGKGMTSLGQGIAGFFKTIQGVRMDPEYAAMIVRTVRAIIKLPGSLATTGATATGVGVSPDFLSSVTSFVRGTQKLIRDLSKVANGTDTKSIERVVNSIRTLRSTFFGGTDSKGNVTRGLIDEISKFSAMKLPAFQFPIQADLGGFLKGMSNFGAFAGDITRTTAKFISSSKAGQAVAGKGRGLAATVNAFAKDNLGVDLSNALDKINKSGVPQQIGRFALSAAKMGAIDLGNSLRQLIQPNQTVKDIKAFGRFFGLVGKELSKAVSGISQGNLGALKTVAESIDRFAKGVPLIIAAASKLPKGLFSNLPVVRFFKYKDFRSFLYFAKYISRGLADVAKITAKTEGFENLSTLARSVSRFANAINVMNNIKLPQGNLGILKIGRLSAFRDFFVFAKFAASEFAKLGNIKNLKASGESISAAVKGISDIARLMGDNGIIASANTNVGALKSFVRGMVDALNPLSKLRIGGMRNLDIAKNIFPARSASESEKSIGRFGSSISKFGGRSKGFVSNLMGVNRALHGNSGEFKNWSSSLYGALDSVGRNIENVSRNLLRMGGLTSIMRSGATQSAIEYEHLATQLSVFGANIPLDEAKAFADEIGIKYPQSSAEALQAILDLAKAGQDLPNIKNILPTAADLSLLGDIDLTTSTQGLIAMVSIFERFNEETPATFNNITTAADTINAAANISTASVNDLLEAYSNVGTGASDFGLNAEETAAIFALFSDSAIRGAEAGTQLRQIIEGLKKDESLTALRELGLDIYDANGQLLPFNDLLESIAGTLSSMSDERRIGVLDQISTTFGGRGLSVLIRAGGIEDTIAQMQGLESASDSAQRILKSVKNQIEQLRGSFSTLSNSIFQTVLQRAILPFIQGATALVNTLNDLPQSVKDFAAGVLVVVPAVITLVGSLGLVIAGFLRFTAVLTTLSQVYGTLRFGVLAANIGALVQAVTIGGPVLIALGTIIATLAVSFNTFYKVIQDNIGGAGDAFNSFLESVGNFGASIQEFIRNLGIVFNLVFGQKVIDSIQRTGEVVAGLFSRLASGFDDLTATVQGNSIYEFLIGQLLYLREPIEQVIGFIETSATAVANFAEKVFGVFSTALKGGDAASIAEAAFGPIGRTVVNLVQTFSTAFFRIRAIVREVWEGLGSILTTLVTGGRGFEAVGESIGNFAESVVSTVGRVASFISDNVLFPLQKYIPVIVANINAFLRTVLNITAPLREFVMLLGDNLFGVLQNIADFLGSGDLGKFISDFANRIGSLLTTLGSAIADTLENLGRQTGNKFLVNLASSLRDGSVVQFVLAEAWKLIQRIAATILDAISKLPDQIYELGLSTGNELLQGIGKALQRGDFLGAISFIVSALGSAIRKGIERAFEIASQAVDEFLDQFSNRVVGGVVLFVGTALIAAIPIAIQAALPRLIAFISATGIGLGKLLGTSITLGFMSFPLGLGVAAAAGVVAYIALIANTVANDPDGSVRAAGERTGETLAEGLNAGIESGMDETARKVSNNADRIRGIWDRVRNQKVDFFDLAGLDAAIRDARRFERSMDEANDTMQNDTLRVVRTIRNEIEKFAGAALPGDLENFFQSLSALPASAVGNTLAAITGAVEYLSGRWAELLQHLRNFGAWFNENNQNIRTGIFVIGSIFSAVMGLFVLRVVQVQYAMRDMFRDWSNDGKTFEYGMERKVSLLLNLKLAAFLAKKAIDELLSRTRGKPAVDTFEQLRASVDRTTSSVDRLKMAFDKVKSGVGAVGSAIRSSFSRVAATRIGNILSMVVGATAVTIVGDSISKGLVKFFESRQLVDVVGGAFESLLVTVSDIFFEPLLGDQFTETIQETIRQIEFVVGQTLDHISNQITLFAADIGVELNKLSPNADMDSLNLMARTIDILKDGVVSATELQDIMTAAMNPTLVRDYGSALTALIRENAGAFQGMFADAFSATDGADFLPNSAVDDQVAALQAAADKAKRDIEASYAPSIAAQVVGFTQAGIDGGREATLAFQQQQEAISAVDEQLQRDISALGVNAGDAFTTSLFRTLAQSNLFEETFNMLFRDDFTKSLEVIASGINISQTVDMVADGVTQEQHDAMLNSLKNIDPIQLFDYLFDYATPEQLDANKDQIVALLQTFRGLGTIDDAKMTEYYNLIGITEDEVVALTSSFEELWAAATNVPGDELAGMINALFDSSAITDLSRSESDKLKDIATLVDDLGVAVVDLTDARLAALDALKAGGLISEEAYNQYSEVISGSQDKALLDAMDYLQERIQNAIELGILSPGTEGFEEFVTNFADKMTETADKVDFSFGEQVRELGQQLKDGEIDVAEYAAEYEKLTEAFKAAREAADATGDAITRPTLKEFLLNVAGLFDALVEEIGPATEALREFSDEELELAKKRGEFSAEEEKRLIEEAQAVQEKRDSIGEIITESDQERIDKEQEYQQESLRNYEDFQKELLDIQKDAEEEIFDAVLERDAASAQRAAREARKQQDEAKSKYDLDAKRRKEDFDLEVAANKRERDEKIRAAQQELADLITKQQRERQTRIREFNSEIADMMMKNSIAQVARNQDVTNAAQHSVTMTGIVGGIFSWIEGVARRTLTSLSGTGAVQGPAQTGTVTNWGFGLDQINAALIAQGLVPLPAAGGGGGSISYRTRAAGGPVEPWSAYKVHDTTSPELLALRDGTSMLLTGKYGGYVQPLSPQNRSGGYGSVAVSVDFSGMSISTPSGSPSDIASAIEDRVIGKIADTISMVVDRRMKR